MNPETSNQSSKWNPMNSLAGGCQTREELIGKGIAAVVNFKPK